MYSDLEFLQLVYQKRYSKALVALPQVRNMNRRHPAVGMPVLHMAVSDRAFVFIKAICAMREDIDFLALDRMGRRATDIVRDMDRSDDLYDYLLRRETRQELGLMKSASGGFV